MANMKCFSNLFVVGFARSVESPYFKNVSLGYFGHSVSLSPGLAKPSLVCSIYGVVLQASLEQVKRIAASPVVAFVKNIISRIKWSIEPFKHHPVSLPPLFLDRDATITSGCKTADPLPTIPGALNVDLTPESFHNGNRVIAVGRPGRPGYSARFCVFHCLDGVLFSDNGQLR